MRLQYIVETLFPRWVWVRAVPSSYIHNPLGFAQMTGRWHLVVGYEDSDKPHIKYIIHFYKNIILKYSYTF